MNRFILIIFTCIGLIPSLLNAQKATDSYLIKVCDSIFIFSAIDYNLLEENFNNTIINYEIVGDSLIIDLRLTPSFDPKSFFYDFDTSIYFTSTYKIFKGIKYENGIFKMDELLFEGSGNKEVEISITIGKEYSLIFDFKDYYSYFGYSDYISRFALKKNGKIIGSKKDLKQRIKKKYCAKR
ncbi:MAG: hypothetical protein K1X55_01915 [Chitinophagales bacterium]|nr:hypothetical protein [Chitinophagales bacterium]